MNNYTNIYDIDGNIIRKAGDNHKFTVEEVEKLVDDLTAKVQEHPENETYKVYLNNANRWLYNMYQNMSTKDIAARLSSLKNSIETAKEQAVEVEEENLKEINNVIDEFKAQYDEGNKEDIRTLHSGESETDSEGPTE